MKELQQGMLNEAGEIGLLNQQKVNWMLNEHKATQEKLENVYDEEISRQRMLLEEKLERRRAMAKTSVNITENLNNQRLKFCNI